MWFDGFFNFGGKSLLTLANIIFLGSEAWQRLCLLYNTEMFAVSSDNISRANYIF